MSISCDIPGFGHLDVIQANVSWSKAEGQKFLLESTRVAFLESVLRLVQNYQPDINLFENQARSLEAIPGDEIDREINRRGARDLRSRSTELTCKISSEIDRLINEYCAMERFRIADKGSTIYATYSEVNFSFGYTKRRIVLWPDGRFFLVEYKEEALAEDNLEEVRYEVFNSRFTKSVTDSLGDFSDAELAAVQSFQKVTNLKS